MPGSHGYPTAILIAVLASGAASDALAAELPTVRPGGVVRWPGVRVDRCGMEGRWWDLLDGACYYPVDLLREPGILRLERRREGRLERRDVLVGPYPYSEQRITIQDDSKVHLSQADLDRSARESRRVAALWNLDSRRRFELPLAPPLRELPTGGRFGARRIFNGEPRSPHTGADFSAAEGEPVLAVAAGRVALAEEHFFSGNSVFIDHGDGLISMYFHLRSLTVRAGDDVARGQPIGSVGMTGRATGPHLHFGLRWHGARVDPELLLGRASDLLELPAAP